MRIAFGADHAGYELKGRLVEYVRSKGHEVIDVGTHGPDSVDYPSFGRAAAQQVLDGAAELAVLVCGTGVGIGMSAGKMPGIRCAMVSEPYSARLARQHNDANVLAIGSRVLGPGLAEMIVDEFLQTAFEGGRHARRVGMIEQSGGEN
ncbi:ribose 5-phosphate isomerase B [Propionibacterium australiense]|uniref:Ribose-5-phosphate isomerase n=1 Tax=Propionibacterium australiense TaxID=119981 RepID=A0A383S7D6_9ACTN|nr:ribose 5-phosphate isomerase B [Propionibacterium australiense]SYZ33753.1 Ribose-5-phosphate isomerase [Propionibacterium australiense]VEH88730.1 Ribose-5-phosphate isomerase B [Propionibacterium australiense]